MAYEKPIRPAMIIASEKIAKFSAQKSDSIQKEKRKQMAEIFKANNTKE